MDIGFNPIRVGLLMIGIISAYNLIEEKNG